MMKKINKKNYSILFIFCIFIGCSSAIRAQNPDLRIRLYGELQKEITRKIDVNFKYEHRLNKYITSFDKAFFEPSLSYSLNNNIRFGASYRMGLNQNNLYKRKIQNRTSAYAQYRFEFDDFRLRIRSILQYGFDDLSILNDFLNNKLVTRNSIQIDYNWFGTKFKPYSKYEFFIHLNHPQGTIINQQRLSFGTNYDINNTFSLKTFYMFENEMNIVNPLNIHILGAGIDYSF